MSFLRSVDKLVKEKAYHYFNGKEPVKTMKKLTFEQAQSLNEQGIISDEKFAEMINSGDVKVFRFRKVSEDKPAIVHEMNAQILKFVESKTAELLEANYKPSITWNVIKKEAEAEED